ncbi:Putative beta-barrel porin-2, OmpL-like. bbp2 [Chitinophaga costaii]|uniref:Putative beta-barrel porin-2, OmpL-like. bbp2 n=1 Tax=Chitinophaga costaii TaxID=1335309 RepID=A0A1C4DNT4_9BACT|nr:outer membrane beta-barrel protein [Chitinophaga costaii]PUZ27713.1 porin [Chitinophaga costaii]SCC32935.1 Putative beta-barrel porin-2, OmpL-like. bbp2 [Chitinophaga costaii]
MMLKISLLFLTVVLPGLLRAQGPDTSAAQASSVAPPLPPPPPPTPALLVTGSVDVYYRYDFNKTNTDLTSFTSSHDQFRLGMATVKLEHKTSKLDMVADLGVGSREQEFAYHDNGIVQAIKQLYISYAPTAWVKVTAGTWATHVGYEVLDANANRNYSMSYMFSNGPFSHTGVRADFTVGKSGLMIGVSQPTDVRSVPEDGSNNKNLLAQYSYVAGDHFKCFFNYVGGRDMADTKVHQYDLVINTKASTLVGIGFNATANTSRALNDGKYAASSTWWGAAVYLNLDPKPWLGLTLRSEYFNDKDGVKMHPFFVPESGVTTVLGANVFANTLSANFKVGGLTVIPEFRYDYSSAPIFMQKAGASTTSGASLLFAAVYAF